MVSHLGGVVNAVATQGSYAYIGMGSRFVILNISNPSNPMLAGRTAPLPELVQAIAVVGSDAYIAERPGTDFSTSGGLRIVDVTNPVSPVLVSSYPLGSATAVTLADSRAYVTDSWSGLQVLDVSNPATPILIGYYRTPGNAMDVTVVGRYVYVGALSGGLWILRYTGSTPLAAAFTAAPNTGKVPLSVTFTNESRGDFTASLWNFGDGGMSTQHSPTHTYTASGTFTVTLTVTGPSGTADETKLNYIATVAPSSRVSQLLAYQVEGSFPIRYSVSDASGVHHVELWYRYRRSDPSQWSAWTLYGSYTSSPIAFAPPQGPGVYRFRTVAVDTFGNREAPPARFDANTRFVPNVPGQSGFFYGTANDPTPDDGRRGKKVGLWVDWVSKSVQFFRIDKAYAVRRNLGAAMLVRSGSITSRTTDRTGRPSPRSASPRSRQHRPQATAERGTEQMSGIVEALLRSLSRLVGGTASWLTERPSIYCCLTWTKC